MAETTLMLPSDKSAQLRIERSSLNTMPDKLEHIADLSWFQLGGRLLLSTSPSLAVGSAV